MHPRLIPASLALALLPGLLLAGCAGGGGSSSTSATETRQVTVALTDAPSDEVTSFNVDVTSFRFRRDDGAVVEVLPQRTRVDFAQLVEVSEVIAAASLPVGRYTAAFVTLDFNGAQVLISGNASPATLLDGQGLPLGGARELEVVFPGGGFSVGARKGHFAEVDFDLDQSLTVDAAANTVRVDAVLYARIDPLNPKEGRAPGLASGFAGDRFQLDVRLGLGLVSRAHLEVRTSAGTVYELDGQVLVGQAGFDALAGRGDGSLVLVSGTIDPAARTLTARSVSLLPQGLDEVAGLVVARSGGPGQDATLTLRGVVVNRQDGSVTLNDTVTLRTSILETRVGRRGLAGQTLTCDAINVGQRLLAYGHLNGTTLDLTGAGAGFVRLVETEVSGTVTRPAAGGRLELSVARIGRRLVGAFDFDVAGEVQADPARLLVDTGSLGLASVTSGSVVVARGFFPPVGTAVTEPDFKADSVVDRSDAASLLRVWWLLGTPTPFSQTDPELRLDVATATLAQVDRGLVVPVQLTSDAALTGAAGSGLFALRRGLTLTLFADYASWQTRLVAEVGAGAQVVHLRAIGRWDDAAGRMTAGRACVTLR